MIINQRFADMHFRGEDPIGKRIRLINDGNIPGAPKFYQATIIGIAPNIRQRGFEIDPDPVVYITHAQNALMAMNTELIVRARSDPAAMMSLLRQEISAMDPDVPVTNIRTMDEILARNRWPQRVFGTMFLVFAIIAIVLAAVGLYSVTAYSVAQRTQEIGIRMALGAEGEQVRWLILRRGMIQVGVGLTLGLAAALGTGRLLQGMLVGTGPADVVTLVSISVVLVIVAAMACFWPARRATRLDPVKALRYQ
jgi:ABC-type antimicrobial peptide transport system permease subunit